MVINRSWGCVTAPVLLFSLFNAFMPRQRPAICGQKLCRCLRARLDAPPHGVPPGSAGEQVCPWAFIQICSQQIRKRPRRKRHSMLRRLPLLRAQALCATRTRRLALSRALERVLSSSIFKDCPDRRTSVNDRSSEAIMAIKLAAKRTSPLLCSSQIRHIIDRTHRIKAMIPNACMYLMRVIRRCRD